MALPSPTAAIRVDPAVARTRRDEQLAVMIRFLSIRDLAIVDAMDIEFEQGFNVLTGETGAGKSIIIGALGLLVGERGGGDLVRTGASRALVQATFETEEGKESIVRREIPTQGRARIFIDDVLAPRRDSERSAEGSSTSTASTSTRSSSTHGRTSGCWTPTAGSNPPLRRWPRPTTTGGTPRSDSKRNGAARWK